METLTPYTLADCGCFFDGSRGRYIGELVIAEAIAAGWKPADAGYTEEETEAQDLADQEYYHDLWDSAENFLQGLAPEGAWFGANESGDWGLWESDSDEEREEG